MRWPTQACILQAEVSGGYMMAVRESPWLHLSCTGAVAAPDVSREDSRLRRVV
jgi:hypothetical protein